MIVGLVITCTNNIMKRIFIAEMSRWWRLRFYTKMYCVIVVMLVARKSDYSIKMKLTSPQSVTVFNQAA